MSAQPITFIVSYRDREEHLEKFVAHYKDLFPDCEIFVVEQLGNAPFKRGQLLNIGFLESWDNREKQVYDFCDIDMLAEDGQVDWSFPKDCPAHLATQASQFNYQMPYSEYYSGHILFTAEQYSKVNGYANFFEAWGCEDNNLYLRVKTAGYKIEHRYPGRFKSLPHKKQEVNQECYKRGLEYMVQPHMSDGLTSCKYNVVSTERNEGYTHIKVEL